jgi:hypothetical protein
MAFEDRFVNEVGRHEGWARTREGFVELLWRVEATRATNEASHDQRGYGTSESEATMTLAETDQVLFVLTGMRFNPEMSVEERVRCLPGPDVRLMASREIMASVYLDRDLDQVVYEGRGVDRFPLLRALQDGRSLLEVRGSASVAQQGSTNGVTHAHQSSTTQPSTARDSVRPAVTQPSAGHNPAPTTQGEAPARHDEASLPPSRSHPEIPITLTVKLARDAIELPQQSITVTAPRQPLATNRAIVDTSPPPPINVDVAKLLNSAKTANSKDVYSRDQLKSIIGDINKSQQSHQQRISTTGNKEELIRAIVQALRLDEGTTHRH